MGALNTRGLRKIRIFSQYLATRKAHGFYGTLIRSHVQLSDRFPMILSDLERRNAGAQFCRRIFIRIPYAHIVWSTVIKFGTVTMWQKGVFVKG